MANQGEPSKKKAIVNLISYVYEENFVTPAPNPPAGIPANMSTLALPPALFVIYNPMHLLLSK